MNWNTTDFPLGRAKKFSEGHNLTDEVKTIEAIRLPKSWQEAINQETPGAKWWIKRLKRRVFVLLWRHKGILEEWESKYKKAEPNTGNNRFTKALQDFLATPEGSVWLKNNGVYWLSPKDKWTHDEISQPPRLPALTIMFSVDQKTEFTNLAEKFGVEPEVLAKIWILEHLHQLQ